MVRAAPDPGAGEGPLPARDAYRLWAPTYEVETVVSALEDRVVRELELAGAGRSLLDVGCGTGRRLRAPGAAGRRAVGVDLAPEMLAVANRSNAQAAASRPGITLVAGDARALPLRSSLFDRLWCRLVLGHVRRTAPVYRELRRVATDDATLVVSDVHPDAVAAGHSRTFRDQAGLLRTVEHHVHTPDEHRRVAAAAGWTCRRTVEAPAGAAERPFYERAGREEQFERERALPLVLVMWFGL